MKAVIQIVDKAVLTVDDKEISKIDKGLVVYLGIKAEDTQEKAKILAEKIANLRIFKDENGKLNLSLIDIKGQILAVSNFTLYADATRGKRPNYAGAMAFEEAEEMYKFFLTELQKHIEIVKGGVFGGHMVVSQVNRGPVNIVLEY